MTPLDDTEAQVGIPRLAVIDDGVFDQMLYERIIERTGLVAETLSFLSAEDAIGYFEGPGAEPADVILLDINMPGMSGFDFLDHVAQSGKEFYARSVIIMLTTSLAPSDKARASSHPLVKRFIQKPLEASDLVSIAALVRDTPLAYRSG